jgi:hypothetical protein
MKIICLACGHKVDLGDAYDDYEGRVKCFACRSSLEIRTEDGNIKAVKHVSVTRHPPVEKVYERILSPLKQAA